MFTLLMLGPPGAGKGTQSKMLAEKYNLMHVSTGELLRSEINRKTETGLIAQYHIDQGNLVPDDILIAMLRELLDTHKGINGFIFDGFPRTIPQAEAFDAMLEERNTAVNLVLALKVSEAELLIRLLKRAEVEGRSDDKPEIIRQRIHNYNNQTKPLLDYYSGHEVLTTLYGIGQIPDIFNLACLEVEEYINLS